MSRQTGKTTAMVDRVIDLIVSKQIPAAVVFCRGSMRMYMLELIAGRALMRDGVKVETHRAVHSKVTINGADVKVVSQEQAHARTLECYRQAGFIDHAAEIDPDMAGLILHRNYWNFGDYLGGPYR